MDTIEKIYARIDPCDDEAEDIRAILMLVLDGEHSKYRYPVGCNCLSWADEDRCRGYQEGRARIAALGNEEE